MSEPDPSPTPLANDPFLRDVPIVAGFKTLDPAALHSKLGQGGMGAVYRGRHLVLGIDVAVKCLLRTPGARAEEMLARFRREANIAAQLSHENLVRLYERRDAHGLSYLILELVEGETAHARVVRKGPLSEREAATIVMCASRGLAKAHRHQEVIVHRDVKPANILISKRGDVKLADLGLAKAVDHVGDASFHTDGLLGTPHYMAPEQWDETRQATPRTDVWAMGATLYYLLTGRAAFRGHTTHQIFNEVVNRPFPDPRLVRTDVSPEIARIVRRCTKRDPAQRYADAGVLARELQNYLRARQRPARIVRGGDPQTTVPNAVPPSELEKMRAPAPPTLEPAAPPPLTVEPSAGNPAPVAPIPVARTWTRRTLALGGGAVGLLAFGAWIWSREDRGAVDRADRSAPGQRVRCPDSCVIDDATPGASGWARRVRVRDTDLYLRLVEPAGPFWMGSDPADPEAAPNEARHSVTLSRPYYCAETETTEDHYDRVMRPSATPSGSRLPKVRVSWQEAREFCGRIGGDLPTEAQWEHMARAGSTTRYFWGDQPGSGAGKANVFSRKPGEEEEGLLPAFPFDDGCAQACSVASFDPNSWGFYDVLGNVAEWCLDAYHEDHGELGAVDPLGGEFGTIRARVARGGSWRSPPSVTRSASRRGTEAGAADGTIGFRAVIPVR